MEIKFEFGCDVMVVFIEEFDIMMIVATITVAKDGIGMNGLFFNEKKW